MEALKNHHMARSVSGTLLQDGCTRFPREPTSHGPSSSEAMGSPDGRQNGIYKTQRNLNNIVKPNEYKLCFNICHAAISINTTCFSLRYNLLNIIIVLHTHCMFWHNHITFQMCGQISDNAMH